MTQIPLVSSSDLFHVRVIGQSSAGTIISPHVASGLFSPHLFSSLEDRAP